MSQELKFVGKIIQIGGSIGVIIPKDIKDLLNLKKDDYLHVSIEKINKEQYLSK